MRTQRLEKRVSLGTEPVSISRPMSGFPHQRDRWKHFELLSDGGVELILEDACVETTARLAYREIMDALLEEKAGEQMHAVLEALEVFLLRTNFGEVRSAYPELAGGIRCRVKLWSQGRPSIRRSSRL